MEIVVTGFGIKAPGVTDEESFLHVLRNGICTQSILEIENGNVDQLVAGVVASELLEINGKSYKRYSRAARLAIAASLDAYEQVDLSAYEPDEVAIIVGTAAGAILEIEQYAALSMDLKTYPLHGVSYADANTIGNNIAYALNLKGPTFTLTSGCTSSIDAIQFGQMLLESGKAKACIVVGADAPLGQWTINGFLKLRSLAKNTELYSAGVPFSKDYDGFTLSEGAAALVLENKEIAMKRNATMYGKIERVVSKNEGQPLLGQDLTGDCMLSVMKETLQSMIPTYINSQALGLQINDKIEAKNAKLLFSNTVPITSIKGMIGHTFGATGIVQVISSLLSIRYGFIPPTIKTNRSGFEDLNLVTNIVETSVQSVCVTTHSSSGNNACVLVTEV